MELEKENIINRQKLVFTSSNKYKRDIFKGILGNRIDDKYFIEFQTIPDLPEIQGNCEQVVIDKAIKAYDFIKHPCIVDDESFLIEELGGFPGPYLKDFEKNLKTIGIYNLLSKLESDICYPQVNYAVTFDGKNVHVFSGKMKCSSIKPRDGKENTQNYYEAIKSMNLNKRMEEISEEETLKNKFEMRRIALEKLINFLNN